MTVEVLKPGSKSGKSWIKMLIDVTEDIDQIEIEIKHPSGRVQVVTVLQEGDRREPQEPLELLVPGERTMDAESPDVDTLNRFAVAVAGDGMIVVLAAIGPMTESAAVNLAAWLVALTGRRDEFLRLLEAIERT